MKDPLSLSFSAIVGKGSANSTSHAYIMSIRKLLSPLLMISYVCGSRMIEFPVSNVSRQRFNLLYMLLLWSLYNVAYVYVVLPFTTHRSILYHIWFGTNMFIAFLSIIMGIYHDKAFRNCMKNLTIVDDTLEKLGTLTDDNLHMRTIWFILGWFIITILISCLEIPHLENIRTDNTTQVTHVIFIRMYYININIISDLIITSMLWYVGLKFDQINECLEKLTNGNGNECRIKRAREHPVIFFHQFKHTKTSRNEYMIWITIHLHLELRKISRTINLIFGTQMTIEMGCYFILIACALQNVLKIIFAYDSSNILYIILVAVWLFLHIFKIFLINYECERVSIKANETGKFISNLSYSNFDIEIRQNILQFLLMTQSPFRFYGLGLFQFGFKFLQRITMSVVTVVVILLQSYVNKYIHF